MPFSLVRNALPLAKFSALSSQPRSHLLMDDMSDFPICLFISPAPCISPPKHISEVEINEFLKYLLSLLPSEAPGSMKTVILKVVSAGSPALAEHLLGTQYLLSRSVQEQRKGCLKKYLLRG